MASTSTQPTTDGEELLSQTQVHPRGPTPTSHPQYLSAEGFINSTRPACRLPPEILTRIFLASLSKAKKNWQGRRKLTWMRRFTHVCHYWREIALGYPGFWADLSYMSPRIMDMSLVRSGSWPLTIAYRPRYTDTHTLHQAEGGLARALAQTDRLRCLKLEDAGFEDDLPAFLRLLGRRAPQLEHLSFSCSKDPYEFENLEDLEAPEGSDDPDKLPRYLFSEGAPSLKTLFLAHCGLPWDRVPFSTNLTHLHILNYKCPTEYRASRAGFIETIGSMGSLEVLHLHESLPRCDPLPTSPANLGSQIQVVLPALRDLHLRDSAARLGQFFDTFRLPNANSVQLEFTDSTVEPQTLNGVLSDLHTAWKGCRQSQGKDPLLPRHIVINNIHFDLNEEEYSRHRPYFWSVELSTDDTITSPGSTCLTFKPEAAPWSGILTALRASSALSALEDIWCRVDDADTAFWGALAPLGSLKSVHFQGWDGSTTPVVALLRCLDPGEVGDNQGPPFPSLSTVECAFASREWEENKNAFLSAIEEGVKRRPDTCPILDMVIDSCGRHELQRRVSQLETVAPRVRFVSPPARDMLDPDDFAEPPSRDSSVCIRDAEGVDDDWGD